MAVTAHHGGKVAATLYGVGFARYIVVEKEFIVVVDDTVKFC